MQARSRQKVRQEKEAAEAADQAKSQFLATMSHEIRTPINGVLGMVDLLAGTPLNEEQKSYLLALKSSSQTLLAVINDVLDYSKIEAGKLQIDNIVFDPRQMVNESLAVSFGWAKADELARMKELTYKVNDVLKKLFDDAGMLLVDYKLEFGRSGGQIVLGDQFSPDGCRIWDKETRRKMDKDRFRQGLGEVIETYEEVGRRLGIQFD